ncbi:helix-turn-helix domain-containing protein [Foetidibacter luteolus]|uniref:helix-turn-helix domain-containing protein n=1 Tax=Foetidibacter luteolus TaxID=2608880 RepID=UPI00129BB197|nr:helix-turn-helix domain-containing protein [Foetidibacter luteolus]
MVSARCKTLVKEELKKLSIEYASVELGETEILQAISPVKRAILNAALCAWGFELLDDKKSILVEKIKNIITVLIHYSEEPLKINFSVYLSEELKYNYTYLANLFAEHHGITIEHYIIAHKIERVKELLVYDELSLTEIAFKLHYSSVSHLSGQFKKVTGLTPTHYKQL